MGNAYFEKFGRLISHYKYSHSHFIRTAVILFCAGSFIFSSFSIPEKQVQAASWYDSDWQYRKEITVDNSGNANVLSNYQVKVTLNDTNFDFTKANSDGSDIRFSDADAVSLIDYWIDYYDSVGETAIIWSKVPSIPASTTKTIYMYYGNANASDAGDGLETFEAGGFDGFESRNTGSLDGVDSAFWGEYASNPVLNTTSKDGFSSVFKDGDTYHMYYSWDTALHATSSDGLSWTVDSEHNPILSPTVAWETTNVGVPMVWKEDTVWYMLYRGGTPNKIGLATSSDGVSWTKYASNPVLSGTSGQWDDAALDPWGVMKVGSLYYMWYSTISGTRAVGLATSTDLIHWTKDANNPIFTGGRFCIFPFKYGDYYYMLVPHYTVSSDKAQIELYRDTSPTFYPASREFIRNAINFGAAAAWNDSDQDTPVVLTDDIYRNSFNLTNNQIWTYFAGSPNGTDTWYTGLTIETDFVSALSRVAPFWTGAGSGGTVTVVDTPIRHGSRSIRQSDTSAIAGTQFYTSSFVPKTTGVIGAWMRRSNTTGGGFDAYLYSGDTIGAVAGLGATYFHYWDGSFHNTAVTYTADTWYLVTLEFNTDLDKYNFVVYDTNYNEIVRQDDISRAVGAINKITFTTDSAVQTSGYLDDFRLRQYSLPEPSTSVGAEVALTPPTVTAQAADNITATSASLHGTIEDVGTQNATVRGFKYYQSSDCTGAINDLSQNGDYGTGAFSLSQSSLSVNTQYSYKPYATNISGSAYGACVAFYTLANVPSAPTVNTPAATSLKITVNQNSNPAGTTYAIYETSTTQYIQANGSLGASAVWQDYTTWGGASGVTNTGLSPNVQYTFEVKAKNSNDTETSFSTTASKYTLANVPSAPTVTLTSATSLTAIINQNSNPAGTTYAIYETSTTQYIQANGTLGASAVWQDYTTWGGALGIVNTGLSANTQYILEVKARNADSTETAYSTTAAKYTSASNPGSATATAQSASSIQVDWTSGGAQSKFNVYRNGLSGSGTLVHSANDLTYSDTGLSASTDYTYYVYSVNGDNVENSNYVSATAATQATPSSDSPTPEPSSTPTPSTATSTPTATPTSTPTSSSSSSSASTTTSSPSPSSSTSTTSSTRPDTTSPIAALGILQDPLTLVTSKSVTFDASSSTDNILITLLEWNFGDGSTSNLSKVNHVYKNPGRYTVTLTVYDKAGNKSKSTQIIDIRPSAPSITDITAKNDSLLIDGTSDPNTIVFLTIHSDPYTTQVLADDEGNWSCRLANASEILGQGSHTVLAHASIKLASNLELEGDESKTYDFNMSVDNGNIEIEKQKTRIWQYVSFGFIALVFVLGFIIYSNRRKKVRR
ncbi:MAG: DUF2341 domain-containing protein [Patescibacteria group bacterium]|jgi:hypothetical protein